MSKSKQPLPDLKTRIEKGIDPRTGEAKKNRFITVSKAEEGWVRLARQDPYYFIWYLTGLKPATHHKIWLGNMFHPDRLRCNFVAARESAKTTISVYSVAWMMSKFPLLTYGIIAVSASVAEDRLMMIRNLFYDDRYRNVFPWIHIDPHSPDTKKEFSVWSDAGGMNYSAWRGQINRHRSELVKNPSIFAAGAGGKGVIGKRISGVLLLDDMVDDKYLSTEMQDKMMAYIMQTLEPTVMETGRIWNIGTRWMIEDIYEQLLNNEEWHSVVIPGIMYDEEGNPMSYWPEYWPLAKLDKKKRTMNDDVLFRIMYLCDPTATTAAQFTRDQLEVDLPEDMPELVAVYISSDFASSAQTYSDWSVLMAVGFDADRNYYLLDGMRYKEEDEELVRKIIEFSDAISFAWGRLDNILIEKVNFESFVKLPIQMLRPDLPVEMVQLKGDKHHRAKPLSTWAKRKKLFINQRISFIEQIKSEWLNFPNHRYDDTLDCASLIFQYVYSGTSEAKVVKVVPSAQNIRRLKEFRRKQKEQRRQKMEQQNDLFKTGY